MIDLSHLFRDGPVSAAVPTGQQAPGSLHSSREGAFSPPDSRPALADDSPDRPGPQVDVTAMPARPVLRMGQWNDI